MTDPANAQFRVDRQSGSSGLGIRPDLPEPGRGPDGPALPTSTATSKAEVYVLSEQEKQIGRSAAWPGAAWFPLRCPSGVSRSQWTWPTLMATIRARVSLRLSVQLRRFRVVVLRADNPGPVGAVPTVRWRQVDGWPFVGLTKLSRHAGAGRQRRSARPTCSSSTPHGSPVLVLGRAGEPPVPAGRFLRGRWRASTPVAWA